jgi:hypothetical protein
MHAMTAGAFASVLVFSAFSTNPAMAFPSAAAHTDDGAFLASALNRFAPAWRVDWNVEAAMAG